VIQNLAILFKYLKTLDFFKIETKLALGNN
jgi:hypothetical protein